MDRAHYLTTSSTISLNEADLPGGNIMESEELSGDLPRTISQRTWDFAREAYIEYLIAAFDHLEEIVEADLDILETYERFRDAALDLDIDFWSLARFHLEASNLVLLRRRIYDPLLEKLVEILELDEVIGKINTLMEEAEIDGRIARSRNVAINRLKDEQRIEISVLDILESTCDIDFVLAFSVLDEALHVSVQTESRQKWMVFGDDSRWNNPESTFLLGLGPWGEESSAEVGRWARRWLGDFLDAYRSYCGI